MPAMAGADHAMDGVVFTDGAILVMDMVMDGGTQVGDMVMDGVIIPVGVIQDGVITQDIILHITRDIMKELLMENGMPIIRDE